MLYCKRGEDGSLIPLEKKISRLSFIGVGVGGHKSNEAGVETCMDGSFVFSVCAFSQPHFVFIAV